MDQTTSSETFRAALQDSSRFSGIDGGDPGSPEHPSIWLFGIEPGWSKADAARENSSAPVDDLRLNTYAIDLQLGWPYNRNAFKLLAAIEGLDPKGYRDFARERRPFEQGSRGYFKGNLSPIAFQSSSHWDDDARSQTGFDDRASYEDWLMEHHLPVIAHWVNRHKPKLFIGVGTSRSAMFAQAVGASVLQSKTFAVNGHGKHVLWATDGHVPLFIVPHLSGGANGLNSFAAVRTAGQIARDLFDL